MTAPGLPAGALPGFGPPGADGLPPLHVPLRFFLTAALSGVLLGGLWLLEGDAAFGSRWATSQLAATHLLTLGFFVMVMFGALFQVVPVLGGGAVPRAVLVGSIVHPCLGLGTGCLAWGLWNWSPGWMQLGGLLLALAFLVFVPAVGVCVLRARALALRPVRLAVGAFAVAVALGLFLAVGITFPELGITFRSWTNVHAAWGGLGFGLLLVVGVSHQVVPMFHVTPAYGPRTTRFVPPAIGAGLVLLLLPWPAPRVAGVGLAAAAGLWHVHATLRLLQRRRRRRLDPTVLGWQCGLFAVGAGLWLALVDAVAPEAVGWVAEAPAREVLVAALFGFAGLGTVVVGMLTKIVPFLAFLHLQRLAVARGDFAAMVGLPTMDRFVGRRAAFVAVGLHAAAAAVVVAAARWPEFGRVAGALAVMSFGWLGVVIAVAALRYGRAARSIVRAGA
ncbi:MAG: hypothetical protein FJ265_07055 [Planctomycetes bacterium]|nr:hypothetical protein [Planctomycetota bacterium]